MTDCETGENSFLVLLCFVQKSLHQTDSVYPKITEHWVCKIFLLLLKRVSIGKTSPDKMGCLSVRATFLLIFCYSSKYSNVVNC